jgi:hypothetical protein
VEALPYQKNVRKPGAGLVKYIGERLPLPIEPPRRRLQEAETAPVESAAEQSNAATQQDEPAPYEPHGEATRIWQDVLERAGDRIDVSSMGVWFEGTTAVGLETDGLIVAVPDTFAEEYIATRLKDILDEEQRSLLSPTAENRLVIGRVEPHNRGGAALGDHEAPVHEGGVAPEDAGLRGKRSPFPSARYRASVDIARTSRANRGVFSDPGWATRDHDAPPAKATQPRRRQPASPGAQHRLNARRTPSEPDRVYRGRRTV